jgi:DNA-binding LacI/PurR family transcriptional regulator
MEFILGVVAGSSARGFHLIVTPSDDSSGRIRIPMVDGIIVAEPDAGDMFMNRIFDAGIPIVTGAPPLAPETVRGVIRPDYFGAMQSLLDHLWERGARRLGALLPEPKRDWAHQLQQGYDDWCTKRGVMPRTHRAPYEPDAPAVRSASEHMLNTYPDVDGIITAHVNTVTSTLQVLAERHRKAEHDILMAACSDSVELAAFQPAITAIDTRPRKTGELCAQLLLDGLDQTTNPATEITLPLTILPPASTAALRRS